MRIWEQPCASAAVPAGPPEPTSGFYVVPNVVGKSAVSNMALSYQFRFTSKRHVKTEFVATELMLARLIYRVEHGRFPESVDALVPDYLPSTPLDDFDGLPIRMSADETMRYSVGEDFVDDCGDANKDVVFPLRRSRAF